MAKEAAIDNLEPTGQASLQNVTTLPKREVDAEPADPGSSSSVTVLPGSKAESRAPQAPAAGESLAVNHAVLSQKLCEAELMLAHAAETGKKLKPDIIATLTNARDANAHGPKLSPKNSGPLTANCALPSSPLQAKV